MTAEREAHTTMGLLHHQHRVPTVLMLDNAMALTAGEFKKKARAAGSIIHPIEAHTPNQNRGDTMVRETKECSNRKCIIQAHPSFYGISASTFSV